MEDGSIEVNLVNDGRKLTRRIQLVGATASVSRRGFADSTEGVADGGASDGTAAAAGAEVEGQGPVVAGDRAPGGLLPSGVALIARQRPRRSVRQDRWVPGPGRLTLADREEITLGVHAGESFTAIAARLGKATSTVSREVAANGGRTQYRAWRAHQRAQQRARRPKTPS
jgi:Helix-turn-helix domain